MKAKTCAILGSTPIDFPWGYDEEDERCHMMKLMLLQGISYCRSLGIRRFSVAIDSGVGLYASEIINSLRNEDREMELVCYVPSEEQATKWTPDLCYRYFETLAACSDVVYSYCHYYESCKFDAMREAVNSANYVLAVLSKERTEPELAVLMHNAERQNLKTLVLYPGEK